MGDHREETIDGKVEDILEDIGVEVEELVQEQQDLVGLRKVPGYNPDFTRDALELDLPFPRVVTARTIAKKHGRQNKFDELYIANGGTNKTADLARIVDEAVGAREPANPLSLLQKAKAWYYRQGPRLKYNTEMIFGSILEYPGVTLGGLFGGAVFSGMKAPAWAQSTLDAIARQDIWYVSDRAAELDFSNAMVTLTSLIAASISYWTGALYLRSRDQKNIYEKYPEIKKRDTFLFVVPGLVIGLGGTAIRGYVTYKMNEWGMGGALAAIGGTLPSQVFAFTAMNIWGTYAGLVRDEEKLKETIIKIKEKRGELPQLEQAKSPGDITPG